MQICIFWCYLCRSHFREACKCVRRHFIWLVWVITRQHVMMSAVLLYSALEELFAKITQKIHSKRNLGKKIDMCFQKQLFFFFLSQIIPPRTNGAVTSSQLLQCSMCLCQIGELKDIGGNRPLLFWRCLPLRLWVTGKSENESKPNTSQISHQNPMETLLWVFFYEGSYYRGFGWLDPLCGHTFYTYTAQVDISFSECTF